MSLVDIKQLISELREAVSSLSTDGLSGEQAQRLVSDFSEGERLCQAGRALAARRVVTTRAWRASGFRSPAQWLAASTHSTLSQAISAVETAHRLDELPATRDAFLSGRLSEAQAAEISAAAVADPAAETSLLNLAGRDNFVTLRERCREVRTAALADEDAAERIRRGRYLRHWSDKEGAVRLDARLTPDDGAKLIAAVTARACRLQDQAHRSGHKEPAEAYVADALVGLVDGPSAPRSVVHVHVDQAAWERGHTVPGERCTIEGVGPVAVSTARRLGAQGVIKALVTDGADVRAVAHLGRMIPGRVRTALEARDRRCQVPGCEVSSNLEIDHIIPLALGGPTALDNLVRLCRYHHAQKTHYGWRLKGRPGEWTWSRDRTARRAPPARAP